MLPDKLLRKLGMRHFANSMRELTIPNEQLVDFSSNDYLGFSKIIKLETTYVSGSTGSRLLSGHSKLHDQVEQQIATFHQVENALLFNSGYDANLGLISSVALRGDLILYDELVHASIRDGIQLSMARSLKYRHNDMDHLAILLDKFGKGEDQNVYVITESVFSMDGDTAPLKTIVKMVHKYDHARLILDEAHALGVIGKNGAGLAQDLELQEYIFARVVTFGKALGSHGAAVLGSFDLQQYLINFARSFIYTTAMPPHALACIQAGYQLLESGHENVPKLQQLIQRFNRLVIQNGLRLRFRESETAIQVCLITGNEAVKATANALQKNGYDVRAILSPTVPHGQERLRLCLHSYNTEEELEGMLQILARILR